MWIILRRVVLVTTVADKISETSLFLYNKICEEIRYGNEISTRDLKKVIRQHLIIGRGKGGSRKGLPEESIYGIINDLIKEGCLKKVNLFKYYRYTLKYDEDLSNSLKLFNKSPDRLHSTIKKVKTFLDKTDNIKFKVLKLDVKTMLNRFPY